jgi:hypothetical protein
MSDLTLKRANEVPGRFYRTAKELWGFRLPRARGDARAVARRALAANALRLGLAGVMGSIRPRRVIRSLGAWHVIFSQRHLGRFIHRAYVTVHMDSRRSIYLIKNRAVPRDLLPQGDAAPFGVGRARAIALRSIRRTARTVSGGGHEEVWYPIRTRLHLAHKFRFCRRNPAEDWIVYVDASNGAVLLKWDNLAAATGRARVFDPNPVVALGAWEPLLDDDGRPIARPSAEAYTDVRLPGLSARSGTLDNARVSTRRTRGRVRKTDLDFRVRSHERGFEEVMAFYHIDRVVRYVESLGYRGARAIFKGPIEVDARAGRDDNSWYSPVTRSLGFGTGDVDDAEDGETIVHELGHALQDAIWPDFGQSAEAAAMGEGFGDYLAASVFADRKTHRRSVLLNAVMTWDGILCPDADTANGAPCVRRVDRALTYESFDHSPNADEHDNGEIWSAALWEIWNELGRDIADRIVIESHFQLDGFTTFARAARAIMDADRHLFGGAHLRALRAIFARRGIGPVG